MNTRFVLAAAALLLGAAPAAAFETFEINGLPPEVALHLDDVPGRPAPLVQASFSIDGLPPQAALHLNDGPILTADATDATTTGAIGFTRQFATLPGEEQVANTPFGPIVILARGAETGGNVGIFRTTEPAGSVGPSHAHTGEVEVFYVLAGTYRFVTGGTTYEGGPGMTIVIPRNVINHYENIGSNEGHLLVWEMPGGFEQFFIDINDTQAATPAAIWELEKQHGIVHSSLEDVVKAGK